MLEHSGLVVERMPGLAAALDQFVARGAARYRAARSRGFARGRRSRSRFAATTLFQAISDCAGLTAALYSNAEPEARLLIALDERIDDLVVASIFGESISSEAGDDSETESPRARTTIETTLVEEFARAPRERARGGLCAAWPTRARLRTPGHVDRRICAWAARHAGSAARFSLPMSGGACRRPRPVPAVPPGAAAQGTGARPSGRGAGGRPTLVEPYGNAGQEDARCP